MLQGHDTAVQSMTWSHNNEFMVSADKAGVIKYWMNNMNEVSFNQLYLPPCTLYQAT